jgi:hypothetical protein
LDEDETDDEEDKGVAAASGSGHLDTDTVGSVDAIGIVVRTRARAPSKTRVLPPIEVLAWIKLAQWAENAAPLLPPPHNEIEMPTASNRVAASGGGGAALRSKLNDKRPAVQNARACKACVAMQVRVVSVFLLCRPQLCALRFISFSPYSLPPTAPVSHDLARWSPPCRSESH